MSSKTDHLEAELVEHAAEVVELDEFRPVWRVARERCRTCDNAGVAVVHAEADHDHLQCTFCALMTAVVTHWETSGDADNPVWESRIVEDLIGNVVSIMH